MVSIKILRNFLLLCCFSFYSGVSRSTELPIDLSSPCFKALKPAPNYLSISDDDQQINEQGLTRTFLPEAIVDWFDENHWTHGYQLWRDSLTCHTGTDQQRLGKSHKLCELKKAPIPQQQSLCKNKSAAINYLAMHKHLIQSRKTLWPVVSEIFSSWEKFPKSEEDYSVADAQWFQPWPNEVLENAMLVDMLGKLSHQELLTRWPSEEDFAQWLICGDTSEGEHVNAIASALQSNATSAQYAPHSSKLPQHLPHQIFWKNIAWLDRAWDRYRMRIGKTPYDPDLQATLLKQCQNLEFWINTSKKHTQAETNQYQHEPLFKDGQLNLNKKGSVVRLLGEAIKIRTGKNDQVYVLMRLNKYGLKPVWITSRTNFSENAITIGEPYSMVGSIAATQAVTRKLLDQAEDILLVDSLQTPK